MITSPSMFCEMFSLVTTRRIGCFLRSLVLLTTTMLLVFTYNSSHWTQKIQEVSTQLHLEVPSDTVSKEHAVTVRDQAIGGHGEELNVTRKEETFPHHKAVPLSDQKIRVLTSRGKKASPSLLEKPGPSPREKTDPSSGDDNVPSLQGKEIASEQGKKIPSQQEKAIVSPSIPDHPPFRQDLNSTVVSHPWINDSACRSYEVRLGVDIPPVYLVSFPRSGNTWTRYLVEGATGIFTGSVYNDKFLKKTGYLGEYEKPNSKKVLLIKDHLLSSKRLSKQTPTVFLIRDPKAAVASDLAYNKGRLMRGVSEFFYKGSVGDPHSKGLEKKIRGDISLWKQVAEKVLDNPTLLVLHYEDIKTDPIKSVKSILSFLKITPDEKRLQCLAKHVEGEVNRGQPDLPSYTAEQIKLFRNAIREVSDMLKKRGLAPLPYSQ